MDFVTTIDPADLVGIKLVAESNQFAVYATGCDTYLLVQRHAGMPWTGMLLSGDGLFRVSVLLSEATRDLYRQVAAQLSPTNRPLPTYEPAEHVSTNHRVVRGEATERRELYADDLTEERMIPPLKRDELAATLQLDPDESGEGVGEPLTRPLSAPR
ncbi:MAG: hypothetical protein QOI11_3795 [Candidatus Eremiobacteraeota bacterium]|jgi:hypothetical protein|nr:hypothetical protein [Candidatus Eremiobacteraeota bacterium]